MRAFDPEAQYEDLVAVGDDGDHLAVILDRLREAGLIAERRLGQRIGRFRLVEIAAVAIHQVKSSSNKAAAAAASPFASAATSARSLCKTAWFMAAVTTPARPAPAACRGCGTI